MDNNGNGHGSRSMLEYGLIAVLVIIVIYAVYYMYNKKKHPISIVSCSADTDCPKGQSCSIPKSMMMYGGSSTGTCVLSK